MHRPDPDALLAAVQKDEARHKRGRLKIFLGMAAGVGKTYAMLQAAHQRRTEGVDIVVGYIETHRRAETEALVTGLEVVPRRVLDYRGAKLEEMDLDAILARHPAIVLVDELAHTNVEGSRHAKRYLDVIELLDNEIDVWTTVNVQHFESRADTVEQITNIRVHETVPDSILDLADDIELIDLSPDDLRKRLREGKVYTAERIETAADNFFRVGNLTALREMSLRLTAERVDHQLQDYMQLKRIAGPWKSGERLMVAISPSPFSEKLIRWTRRMAYNLEADWVAVYVQTSRPLSPTAQAQLSTNVDLARGLGAEIVTTAGDDIPAALMRLARQRNVTQIVLGKPQLGRVATLLRGGTLADQVIRASGDIDVYVVTGDDEQHDSRPEKSVWRLLPRPKAHSRPHHYLLAVGIVAAVTFFDLWIVQSLPWLNYQAVGLTELLAVLLIAVYIGRGPALLAALLSAISWNFLFIEPRLTFQITEAQDIILFLLYFIIAIFAGNLTARIRTQEQQAQYNADRSMALYALAHEISTATSVDAILQTAVEQIGRVFDTEVAIVLGRDARLSAQPHPSSTLKLDEKEYSVALWVFENGRPAGRFTDTLPLAASQFMPLLTPNRTVGVIGIQPRSGERLLFDEEVLLETFVSQIAFVIERELLDEASEQAMMMRESERLYTTLLNSISHELRTPIAGIIGAASSLSDPATAARDDSRTALVRSIQESASRLNQLVENLLDMSRLESGRLQLKREWCDVGELIGVAVNRFDACMAQRPLTLRIAPGLPLVQADFVLIEQVLINILDNLCHYTPPGCPAEITVRLEADAPLRDTDGTAYTGPAVAILIADRGPGIPHEDADRVFDKFYRVPGTAAGGTGLGLSIARGLVEAHGGTLVAEHREEGGACFIVRLPLSEGVPAVPIEAGV
jgi:two-component system sensor histidine kinase KdpD